jgi:3-phosphoshikimate 1-carboxyvinyltransferase
MENVLVPAPMHVAMIEPMRIRPARRIRGKVSVPGDKSISHRAAILAALANGSSTITNFASGADCAATIECLKKLGVAISKGKEGLLIQGVGRRGLRPATATLDCGNSGSTMRMLAGVLAGQNFKSTLIGDESLSSRPMTRIIEPLESMGAVVQSKEGKPPLTITGSDSLTGLAYELPVASAQVKSSILLAGLSAHGLTEVTESLKGTRDHTERMLEWFGVPLSTRAERETKTVGFAGPVDLSARDISVPGDISSAAYFVAAAGSLQTSDLIVADVSLNPTRTGFFEVFGSLGLDVQVTGVHEECNEPIGNIHVTGKLKSVETPINLSGSAISQTIDELPLLAVMGSQTRGGIEIRDAEELRLKESDRIAATAKNLRAMGVPVKEFDDGMKVSPARLRGARIESHGDHRIVMAFTIAALLAEGESEIDETNCVGVSFPEFFETLESVVER